MVASKTSQDARLNSETYPYQGRFKQNLSWPVWGAIAAIAAASAYLIHHVVEGWAFPVAIIEFVMLGILFGYRHFWRFAWFWVRFLPVLLIQWPLIVWARPFVYREGLFFNLFLANVDSIFAIFAINLGRPWAKQE